MLKNIGVKNYRSFDNEGVFLKNLAKVNIVIGKNNSGKSNILRLLKLLSTHTRKLYELSNLSSADYYSKEQPMLIGFEFSHDELGFPLKIQEAANNRNIKSLTDFVSDPIRIWIPVDKERLSKELLPIQLINLSSFHLDIVLKSKGFDSEEQLRQVLVNKIQSLVNERLDHLKGLISVPELRVINPATSHNSGNADINGANIIAQLFEMQHPDVGKDWQRKAFEELETLVKDLLNISSLSLEIPHNKSTIIVKMHEKRLPLENYGSGIYQLILLCAALITHNNILFCIEEPETHLHPELQRKFLDFLIRQTNNTYFITTHSNTFINNTKDVSIFHMEYDGIRSTVNKVEKSRLSYRILDDLGYKASDILQSNGIIWVEGPSDRNYILKWISLIDQSLEEGLHFSIMFYGGKNLANVGFTDTTSEEIKSIDDRLIPLLKINRNAVVIIDSDIVGDKTTINATKERIKLEIGDDNCWITKGKEIENYISVDVIKRWLKVIPTANINTLMYKPLFIDTVKSAFETNPLDYAAKKNLYSHQIADRYIIEDLNYEGLNAEVHKVVQLIKKWNHKQ